MKNPRVVINVSKEDEAFLTYEKKHPFHILAASPWPFFTGISCLYLLLGFVFWMHAYMFGGLLSVVGLVLLTLSMILWFRDIIRESTFEGCHTKRVQLGLRIGMVLFIISEIMFFISFFWAFFHFSLSPSVFVGCSWPPLFVQSIDPFTVPLWNTVLLISSGFTVTLSHHALQAGLLTVSLNSLIATVGLGFIFTLAQLLEYFNAKFDISDSAYGSVFFMTTGFHGFHVIIGSIFLAVCIFRMYYLHFSKEHHLGFEFAIWYWHFVDVVWIFVYGFIYIWSNF